MLHVSNIVQISVTHSRVELVVSTTHIFNGDSECSPQQLYVFIYTTAHSRFFSQFTTIINSSHIKMKITGATLQHNKITIHFHLCM